MGILGKVISSVETQSFHSIRIPSEWGSGWYLLKTMSRTKVSIQLGSPASGDYYLIQQFDSPEESFHSIRIPSEWGSVGVGPEPTQEFLEVSIQLGSPASGDVFGSVPVGQSL